MKDRGVTAPTASIGRLVRVPKTAELIAADLRRQVVTGSISEGDNLPGETELMVQYGVSRPTLREAFRILETENLIEIRRGARGGPKVTIPDVSVSGRHLGLLLHMRGTTIADVYEAWILLEPLCVGLLAARRSEQDVQELQALADEMTRLAALPVPAALRQWSQLNRSFNELITRRCGNATLALQCELLSSILGAHSDTLADGTLTPEQAPALRRLARSCTKLVRLIEARDAVAAQAHWRAHVQTAVDHISRMAPLSSSIVDLFT